MEPNSTLTTQTIVYEEVSSDIYKTLFAIGYHTEEIPNDNTFTEHITIGIESPKGGPSNEIIVYCATPDDLEKIGLAMLTTAIKAKEIRKELQKQIQHATNNS